MQKFYYVYILASARNGTLYIGVTNDLMRRVWEHRAGVITEFTKKYNVKCLVHFEEFGDIGRAIQRETRLKKWKRSWKMRLIEEKKSRMARFVPGLKGLNGSHWMARMRGP